MGGFGMIYRENLARRFGLHRVNMTTVGLGYEAPFALLLPLPTGAVILYVVPIKCCG